MDPRTRHKGLVMVVVEEREVKVEVRVGMTAKEPSSENGGDRD